MSRRLVVLLVLLVAAGISCAVVLRTMPARSVSRRPASRPATSPPTRPAAAEEDAAGYEMVPVKVRIPPLSEFPSTWARGKGCAHTQLCRVLGAQISTGRGGIVFGVEPGKPAAEAGIKPADRLGTADECPKTILGSFFPGKKERTVEWNVLRPRSAAIREKAAEEAAQHAMVSPPQPGTSPAGDPTTKSPPAGEPLSPASQPPT